MYLSLLVCKVKVENVLSIIWKTFGDEMVNNQKSIVK